MAYRGNLGNLGNLGAGGGQGGFQFTPGSEPPWQQWMRDPELVRSMTGGFTDLQQRYRDIADRGILSPEEMNKMLFDFKQSQEPRRAEMRGKMYADIAGRFGPGRMGATEKSIANVVEPTFIREGGDFARNLWQMNVQSRAGVGLQGLEGQFQTLFGGQQNYADLLMRWRLGNRQIDMQKWIAEKQGETDFLDWFEAGSGYMPFGGGPGGAGGRGRGGVA